MKKWEYRVENITTGDFTKEKSLKEIKSFLSEVGSKGWELINVVSTGQKKEGMGANWFNTKKCLFIFKRELK